MIQCAAGNLSSFPSTQATTTSTGSCFIILCAACAPQCSRFLCVHGRGGNSTSSIEIDISDQGNSNVDEKFLGIPSPGLSIVHTCATEIECSVDCSTRECEKCFRYLKKQLPHDSIVSDTFVQNHKDSVSLKGANNSDGEKSENSETEYIFVIADSKSPKIGTSRTVELNINSSRCPQQTQTKTQGRDSYLVQAPINGTCEIGKDAPADCWIENQCELGGVFEGSKRLKRLEEHFRGLAISKNLPNNVFQTVSTCNDIFTEQLLPRRLNEICLQKLREWVSLSNAASECGNCSFCTPCKVKCNSPVEGLTKENPIKTITSNEHSADGDNEHLNGESKESVVLSSDETVDSNECVDNEELVLINLLKSTQLESDYNKKELDQNQKELSPPKIISDSPPSTFVSTIRDDGCYNLDSLPDLLSCTSETISHSVFDVRYLNLSAFEYADQVLECYDELDESSSLEEGSNYKSLWDFISETGSFQLPNSTESSTMRDLNGPLRGLLKKPNRPPPARKNRVVFDETRNEFFEADYIILIREDCAYDEEDEEPCTCGEHELIRLCCEEGCQCNYNEENKTPQSPKYAPPVEFVDDAALSPPEGYKDNGLKNAISGALSGHVFGTQHIQQLQVIQRLQQQRAAMLAARASTQQQQQQQQQQQGQPPSTAQEEEEQSPVCTECAECAECAAKQIQDTAHVEEEISQLSVPAVAIIPLHNNSPERRVTQKEIIAGEERPKYLLPNQHKVPQEEEPGKFVSVHKNQRYVVETITMTTVTERRIVREATEDITTLTASTVGVGEPLDQCKDGKLMQDNADATPTQISGILKGGKLWKHESQIDESNNTSSEDDSNLKRSVRFVTEANKDISREGDGKADTESSEVENTINELIPFKKHSSLFNNALRPNSAMRQLFPSAAHPPPPAAVLTHETLRAFEESKRSNPLMSSLLTSGSETDTIRRSIERNALRRSLIKKKAAKSDISLEERIKQLTCDIEESTEDISFDNSEDGEKPTDVPQTEKRDSPTGEENPSQSKYIPDKSFSPSSSASSSSSGSTSAYKKISNVFNRDKRQEKIPETDENPIIIIPQECRCPAAPDLGMGVQVPAAHTQIHQTPPRQSEPRRQFLSTLAPLTACVAGQKDDFSYYTLATSERNSNVSTQCSEYNLSEIESALMTNDGRKVAPDVIAGTPGQEQDELAAFATQEANRTEKLKKRYSNESNFASHSNASSDDDEQNDYGFNKRPSVRGIKPKFSSTNEILQQMQAQLSQPIPQQQQSADKNFNVSKQAAGTTNNKQVQQQQQQHNIQHASVSQHQSERSWSFYADGGDQRLSGEHLNQNYYQAIPNAIKQTFHGHEESLTYQNCHSVTMEQHYGRYARSPTRRPESPPPLRNYHQTMVLIPYNTDTYAQFSGQDQKNVPQFSRHNILEYQQVTQQTIRVPISYTLPGMQLHVVAGRGAQPQYLHHPRVVAPRAYNFQQDNNAMTYCERGVPEGAAAASDCKNLMSPTAPQGNQQSAGQQHANNQSAVSETVFYAMNV